MEKKGRIFKAPVICTTCKDTFNTLHDISLHRRRHEYISLLCTHCAEIFKTAADMAYHLNQKGAHKREVSEEGAEILKTIAPMNAELSFLTEEMLNELMYDVAAYELINDEVAVDGVVMGAAVRDENLIDDGAVGGAVVHNVDVVDDGDDTIGAAKKNDLEEENRLLKERLYKVNAEKCYWERSAKRMRTMMHWTTGLIAGQEIKDDEEKKEFRKKVKWHGGRASRL